MTERYAHLRPEQVRTAVGKIRGVSRSGHIDEAIQMIEKAKSLK
jgi:hypothetical protein